ncbi:SRPBCC family protein [Pendulispora albinea]|uniref:SRPBCC family protein n=1 Tax=Pendulispora albinea TaxID=2741071 RepID=A0ABZ2LXG3_9BACT
MKDQKRTGEVIIDGERATLAFERRIAHPIQDVWTAITDPAERAAWFGPSRIDPKVGGAVEMTADGPPAPPEIRAGTGTVTVWEPPRVFEFTWFQKIIGETVMRYELTADGDATILRYLHRGLRVRDAQGYIPGSHAYLDRLEAQLDHAALPEWNARYAEVAPAYA